MRKRLQLALMLTASTAIATSFFLHATPVWAAEGDDSSHGITTTDEHGRKIYVNEDGPAPKHATPAAQPKRSSLVYWSSKENRWKPVASAGNASIQGGRRGASP